VQNRYKETYEVRAEDSNYGQNDHFKNVDKRRIVRCEPLTIFSCKNRHNQQALSRQSRNSKTIQEDEPEEEGEDMTSP
jgi:hypothetical protein